MVGLVEAGPRPHKGAPLPISPIRRPGSSTIAATPLEKLPKALVAEAERLLEAGPNAVEEAFCMAGRQQALRRQGVEFSELLDAAERSLLQDVNSVAAQNAESRRVAAEVRYSKQLLAQVLWEAEFCVAAESLAMDRAATIAKQALEALEAEAVAFEISAVVTAPCSPSSGSRSLPVAPSMPPATSLAPSFKMVAPNSSTMKSSLGQVESDGASTKARKPSPERVQLPPPPKPSGPPPTVAESRRKSRYDRAQALAEEQARWKEQQWHDKEKLLTDTGLMRKQRFAAVREKSRERNQHKEFVWQQYKADEQRRQAELVEEAERMERKHDGRVARSKSAHREVAELLGSAAAVRCAVLEGNRKHIQQQEKDYQRQRSERLEKAHAEASERRKQTLSVKSAGPPQLRAAREVARRQAARIERIRQVECEELRDKSHRPSSSEPPSCVGSIWTAPGGVACSRPTTPKKRPHSAGAAPGRGTLEGRGHGPQWMLAPKGPAPARRRPQTCKSLDAPPAPHVVPWPGVAAAKEPVNERRGVFSTRSWTSFQHTPKEVTAHHKSSRHSRHQGSQVSMDTLGKFPHAGLRDEVHVDWLETARAFVDILTWADSSNRAEEGLANGHPEWKEVYLQNTIVAESGRNDECEKAAEYVHETSILEREQDHERKPGNERHLVKEMESSSKTRSEEPAVDMIAGTSYATENSRAQEDIAMAMTTVGNMLERVVARNSYKGEHEVAVRMVRQADGKEAVVQDEVSRGLDGNASAIDEDEDHRTSIKDQSCRETLLPWPSFNAPPRSNETLAEEALNTKIVLA